MEALLPYSGLARTNLRRAQAEHLSESANPRLVVSSLSGRNYEKVFVYEELNWARGEMENRIGAAARVVWRPSQLRNLSWQPPTELAIARSPRAHHGTSSTRSARYRARTSPSQHSPRTTSENRCRSSHQRSPCLHPALQCIPLAEAVCDRAEASSSASVREVLKLPMPTALAVQRRPRPSSIVSTPK